MTRLNTFALAAALAVSGVSTHAADPRAMVVTQAEAPVAITKYSVRYVQSDEEQGINHRVDYKNRTDRRIDAIEVGFVAFNVWNEHLDTLIGNDLDAVGAGKSGDGSWLHNPPSSFLFHTGIAYVSRVRFADGEIWTADLEDIAGQIRSVEGSFPAELLKPKRAQ